MNDKIKSDYFSLELYKRTLLKAIQHGYVFPKISQLREVINFPPKFLALRHDIDVSPINALEMAKIEHEFGITSSYYVLMHSLYYNPAAQPFVDALWEIISLGFEVGLHYEARFFEERNMDPLAGVLNDIAALSHILGIEIKSVSQHNPASSTLLKELNKHYIDAYNNALVNEITYISDSGFKWRDKSLIDLIPSHQKIHALIHPTTWIYGDLDMEGTYRKCSLILQNMIGMEFESFIESTYHYLSRRDSLDKIRKSKYSE